jgi:hypothetical protein
VELLVLTWVMDGKTRAQVEALCFAIYLDCYDRERILTLFDARKPTVEAIRKVRAASGVSAYDARSALRATANDVDKAVARLHKQGFR